MYKTFSYHFPSDNIFKMYRKHLKIICVLEGRRGIFLVSKAFLQHF